MEDFDYEEVVPGILVFDDVIDNPDEIIKHALAKKGQWRDSEIFTNREGNAIVNADIRNTRVLDASGLWSSDTEWYFLSKEIWKRADFYAKKYKISFSWMEAVQILHYRTGTGFYDSHVDSNPSDPRVFSSVLYLNDVKEGGETNFDFLGVTVKPKAGRMIVFPADFLHRHAALPPISEDKFAAVTWYRP